ncbi:MAG: 4-hydroxy-tetrahydrodipicolinate reductase [Parachlamydiales bacterium]
MKVALMGYGKMGRVVERALRERHIEVVARLNTLEVPVTEEAIKGADVCIDFSHPDVVLKHIGIAAKAGKDLVVGTTGWYDHLDSVGSLVEEAKVGLIYAANFSLGMHLFGWVVKEAARLFSQAWGYDCAGYEIHHAEKGDTPSGTAQRLAEVLIKELPEKEKALYERPKNMILPGQLHFGSVRCGQTPGTHTVLFDSASDTIELTHRARNREGFGLGAAMAAHWIVGRKGVYELDDMIQVLMKERS